MRDGAAEAYDEPPPGPLPGPLVEVPPSEPGHSSGLLRADDPATGTADFDKRDAVMAVLDSVAVYGPVN